MLIAAYIINIYSIKIYLESKYNWNKMRAASSEGVRYIWKLDTEIFSSKK